MDRGALARDPHEFERQYTAGGREGPWSAQQPPIAGGHRGHGPRVSRKDEWVCEAVCERLMRDDRVDASEIEVHVAAGEVTLRGWIASRVQRRMAEEVAASVSGVQEVYNELRVGTPEQRRRGGTDPRSFTPGSIAGHEKPVDETLLGTPGVNKR